MKSFNAVEAKKKEWKLRLLSFFIIGVKVFIDVPLLLMVSVC